MTLSGPLGVGKTSLARGLLSALGHLGEVPSPSFAIVQPYEELDPPVWHVDLYRIEHASELEELGLDAAAIGLVQSASSMVDMTLFFPAGYIMDRFGRKFTSVPSFAVMSIGMALIPLTGGYVPLLLVSLVIGPSSGCFAPGYALSAAQNAAQTTMIASWAPKKLTQRCVFGVLKP